LCSGNEFNNNQLIFPSFKLFLFSTQKMNSQILLISIALLMVVSALPPQMSRNGGGGGRGGGHGGGHGGPPRIPPVNISCSSMTYAGNVDHECDVCEQFTTQDDCGAHFFSHNRDTEGCLYFGCQWAERGTEGFCRSRPAPRQPANICEDRNIFDDQGRPQLTTCDPFTEFEGTDCPVSE
jgi:hypothetical protein